MDVVGEDSDTVLGVSSPFFTLLWITDRKGLIE